MKKQHLFLLGLISIFLTSCMSMTTNKQDKIFTNAWELEYITGPRIAFDGLFPDQKPIINFNKTPGTVTGTSGCNVYNTNFSASGNSITIEKPLVSTLAYCGEGEGVFLRTMEEITNYRIESDGKLTLLKNSIPFMRFKKSIIK